MIPPDAERRPCQGGAAGKTGIKSTTRIPARPTLWEALTRRPTPAELLAFVSGSVGIIGAGVLVVTG